MARNDVQLNIRLPERLLELLDRAAKSAGRSRTAELVHRLEVSFPENLEAVMLARRQEELLWVDLQLDELYRLAEKLAKAGEREDFTRVKKDIEELLDLRQAVHDQGLLLAVHKVHRKKGTRTNRPRKEELESSSE